MSTLENLITAVPYLGTALGWAAAQLNSLVLPAASAATVTTGALGVLAVAGLALLLRRRLRPVGRDALSARLDDMAGRLAGNEQLLADAATEIGQLRQRVTDLAARQDAAGTGRSRSSLRQAIALCRHGATQRQLIDTCGLSQGEAHLILNLYGRTGNDAPAADLH